MEIENKPLTISPRPGNPAWLPGVSGNPGGRPKGLAALVRQETQDGAELVAFMLRVLRSKRTPLRQKMEAVAWLADRGFGKALQQMELSGPGGGRIVIGYEDGAADDRAADYPTS
jgi:hypothetical protein